MWSDACPGGSLHTMPSQGDGKRQFQHGFGFSKRVLRSYQSLGQAHRRRLWFFILYSGTAGVSVSTEGARDLEAGANLECLEIQPNQAPGLEILVLWACAWSIPPTRRCASSSSPFSLLSPAGIAPGASLVVTKESKAQRRVKAGSPWGRRGKGNERIFRINKYTSQEKLFPRMCRELPAIS